MVFGEYAAVEQDQRRRWDPYCVDIGDLSGWWVEPDGIDDAYQLLQHRCGFRVDLPVPEYVGNIVARVLDSPHDCREYMR